MVFVAIALPLFFALALLVVDGSRLFVGKRQMQNASDALALAAVQQFSTTGCDATCQTTLTSASFGTASM
jgi:Flp pilus assembly protein TadG